MLKNWIVQVWVIDWYDWDYAFESFIIFNSNLPPSQDLLSLYSSVLWISTINELEQISRCVKCIVIKGGVGKDEETFNLSNLSSLTTLEMRRDSFRNCHSIVFESMSDCMNDE